MNKMTITTIVEEFMKEFGYAATPKRERDKALLLAPRLALAPWKLRHFIHEDNDKILVYIMDDSETRIRLWRDTSQKFIQSKNSYSKVIDLTDPNSMIKVKEFLNVF